MERALPTEDYIVREMAKLIAVARNTFTPGGEPFDFHVARTIINGMDSQWTLGRKGGPDETRATTDRSAVEWLRDYLVQKSVEDKEPAIGIMRRRITPWITHNGG